MGVYNQPQAASLRGVAPIPTASQDVFQPSDHEVVASDTRPQMRKRLRKLSKKARRGARRRH